MDRHVGVQVKLCDPFKDVPYVRTSEAKLSWRNAVSLPLQLYRFSNYSNSIASFTVQTITLASGLEFAGHWQQQSGPCTGSASRNGRKLVCASAGFIAAAADCWRR